MASPRSRHGAMPTTVTTERRSERLIVATRSRSSASRATCTRWVVRRRRPPGPDRARGDLAVHPAQAAARPARRTRRSDGATVGVRVDAARGRHRVESDRPPTHRPGGSSRPGAQRPGRARGPGTRSGERLLVDMPAESELDRADRRAPAPGDGADSRRPATWWSASARTPRPPWSSRPHRLGPLRATTSSRRRRRRRPHRRLASRTGTTTPSTSTTATPGSAATRPSSTSASPSAATWCG